VNNQRIIRRTLLVLALSAFGAGTMAQVPEQEPNHPITQPNHLTFSGDTASVRGTVGGSGTNVDVDFYSFDVQKDEIIKVDIGGSTVDTSIFLFGPPAPTWPRKTFSTDMPTDENSQCDCDPRIDSWLITESGRWVVGVSVGTVIIDSGGLWRGRVFETGSYTLTITLLTPREIPIALDIKPGSAVSPINPKAQGTVPVALLSSDKFTPLDVDPATLTFGQTGDENSFRRCNPSESRDLNADGKPDLVCHFDNGAAGFERGDSIGTLRGKTKTGQAFKGTGDLKVVPEKRQK
jgi:hypothetical protein